MTDSNAIVVPLRILIVDDDEVDRQAVQRALLKVAPAARQRRLVPMGKRSLS
ncbi:MAG: hypothetical protein HC860_24610 [Alkalinema sp. RU_4_3]|nr:hypothetical protein [Alkalinema sp. RU_4_3]